MAAPSNNKVFTAVVLDFETGGLDCKKDGITQIAAHAIRLDTMEVIAKYKDYIKMYPKPEFVKKRILKKKTANKEVEYMQYNWKMMEEKTSITIDMLDNVGVDIKDVCKNIIELCEKATLFKGRQSKPILIGQNIEFDIGFLHQMFFVAGEKIEKAFECHNGFYGHTPKSLDTIDLGRLKFANDLSFSSYSLGSLAEALDIDLFDAHDADSDVEATADIVRFCVNRLRSEGGGAGKVEKIKTRQHFKF